MKKTPPLAFLICRGAPSRQGWSTLTAGAGELALAEELHSGSEEMGCVFSGCSSAAGRGDEGLLRGSLITYTLFLQRRRKTVTLCSSSTG